MKYAFLIVSTFVASLILLDSCKKENTQVVAQAKDINAAAKVSVDRFSSVAGHLMVRTASNGLPAANAPVAFDKAPFITTGFDRTGAVVNYYNFDVQSTAPDDIYVFFKNGASTPISGQNNVIPTIPGDTGYNDFWLVNKVTVPDTYVSNSLTNEADILASGYPITKTTMIVNCPVVPYGSTAARSATVGTGSVLSTGWYKGQAVTYFNFGESALTATATNQVPTSPIYVQFNVDPSDSNPASGPASGFKTEAAAVSQTHNVLATLPGDSGYSPLWNVFVIGNTNFNTVKNLSTATAISSTPAGATVNCPVVK